MLLENISESGYQTRKSLRPRFHVWETRDGFMVMDEAATYVDSFGPNKGDFLRDAVGVAFLYRELSTAEWVVRESSKLNPEPVTTVAKYN